MFIVTLKVENLNSSKGTGEEFYQNKKVDI